MAKKFATLSAVQTEVKAEATGGDNGGQGGSGDRYKAQHKGGGHYTVIDTETGEQAVEETMSKEEAQAVANELNAAE